MDKQNYYLILKKYWWGFLIPIAVIVIAAAITDGKPPKLFNTLATQVNSNDSQNIGTSTVNISALLAKNDTFNTSLERQSFLRNYENAEIYGSGSFIDIGKSDYGYIVTISISGNIISCLFDSSFEKKLLLFSKGQVMNFAGKFTGGAVFGGGWSIHDCSLLDL